MAKEDMLMYAAVAVGIAVLVFVALFISQQGSREQYKSLPNYGTNDCGDMQDHANIQHLSHHPGQYADCLRQVDPQLFYDATGEQLSDFLAKNGIS
ncbi:MAG: hypothetical protein HYY37_00815 [Candidatus Aenigmarchaeota archaeon]|nr:hypothetical protein [Candidatus Aenigmarchaeota archaeon]